MYSRRFSFLVMGLCFVFSILRNASRTRMDPESECIRPDPKSSTKTFFDPCQFRPKQHGMIGSPKPHSRVRCKGPGVVLFQLYVNSQKLESVRGDHNRNKRGIVREFPFSFCRLSGPALLGRLTFFSMVTFSSLLSNSTMTRITFGKIIVGKHFNLCF